MCTLYDADAISNDEVPGSTYTRRITPEPPKDTFDDCEKENEACKKSLTACNTLTARLIRPRTTTTKVIALTPSGLYLLLLLPNSVLEAIAR